MRGLSELDLSAYKEPVNELVESFPSSPDRSNDKLYCPRRVMNIWFLLNDAVFALEKESGLPECRVLNGYTFNKIYKLLGGNGIEEDDKLIPALQVLAPYDNPPDYPLHMPFSAFINSATGYETLFISRPNASDYTAIIPPDMLIGVRNEYDPGFGHKVTQLFIQNPRIYSPDSRVFYEPNSPYPMETTRLDGLPMESLNPRFIGTLHQRFIRDPFMIRS